MFWKISAKNQTITISAAYLHIIWKYVIHPSYLPKYLGIYIYSGLTSNLTFKLVHTGSWNENWKLDTNYMSLLPKVNNNRWHWKMTSLVFDMVENKLQVASTFVPNSMGWGRKCIKHSFSVHQSLKKIYIQGYFANLKCTKKVWVLNYKW